MIITKIEKQKKRDRYNIYIEGKYRFSLSTTSLAGSGIKETDDISELRITELARADLKEKIKSRAYLILSYRSHGEAELRNKLSLKFPENKEIVVEVIKELAEARFLNDRDFVSAYLASSKKGKRLLRLELYKKKLSKDVVEEALAGMTREEEAVKARKLAEKYQNKNNGKDNLYERTYRHLAQKGFENEVIKMVIKK